MKEEQAAFNRVRLLFAPHESGPVHMARACREYDRPKYRPFMG